ncbi:magnesium-translocating P-type ATPase [Methanocella sp. CWC-04]|uniref:Magnesium-transporting ATPase, P-type 1 n=1 Tax=Methanooceanicella nereidis TaxID=2052831 RepID=A0AAP2RCM2_9EURY|nr:magnesium-translocating P-type ATPase [Methanocella sp. CWC-04]MCD1294819.1 magnesium-translocating P-type ATPase [Methanocella sp. CWC-04]
MSPEQKAFWSLSPEESFKLLNTSQDGLDSEDAGRRLRDSGPNVLRPKRSFNVLKLFLAQFKSPIIIILLFAAALSLFLKDPTDAIIIMIIVLVSGLLGFWQELDATNAVNRLMEMVKVKVTVIRDGISREIWFDDVVKGDIVLLSAGSAVPGDCMILESKDLFVNEAVLTGETFPVEKMPGTLPPNTPLSKRTNVVFMGTHAVSGSGKALVFRTGKETEFGRITERIGLKPPEPEFERGVKQFGYLLMEVTLFLIIAIFAINVYLVRPVLESFIFALALAVGLTPQLLPAIISINLARGAKRMASKSVIVKQLSSIENFGSMNVLCSDKTGTITEGIIKVHSAVDIQGAENKKVLFYAYLNAVYETGYASPIDEALRSYSEFDITGYDKVDEVPYDFFRKRLSVLLSTCEKNIMITKGAMKNVLEACDLAESPDGSIIEIDKVSDALERQFTDLSGQGYRTLGIAYREVSGRHITRDDEKGMTFLGTLVLYDPPKPDIADIIKELKELGVSLKIITGDNRLVAASLSREIGLGSAKIVAGPEIAMTGDDALINIAASADVFAEVEPNQKERIILAMKKAGNVVGYIGDGINDGPALHVADVSISVESAVDVAKDAASIVLLEKDLGVLVEGVKEGRVTFVNTLKYVFMATSANFGNMFSMAGASLILPFLPLLPKQILLTNLMTDLPEMTIAADNVDPEMVDVPRRWDIGFIKKFMITFGILSSVFDFLTFGVLILIMNASMDQFRTGWFLESIVSATMIVLVIRTRKPFFMSRPGRYLFLSTLFVIAATLLFPYTPLAPIFGFKPLPPSFILVLGLIVLAYVIMAEVTKRLFYKMVKY